MDRAAWWAAVHGVAKIWTRVKWLSTQHASLLTQHPIPSIYIARKKSRLRKANQVFILLFQRDSKTQCCQLLEAINRLHHLQWEQAEWSAETDGNKVQGPLSKMCQQFQNGNTRELNQIQDPLSVRFHSTAQVTCPWSWPYLLNLRFFWAQGWTLYRQLIWFPPQCCKSIITYHLLWKRK